MEYEEHELPREGEEELWRAWREEARIEAREALFERHLPFARMLAAKAYANRYGDEIEFAEYMQFAVLGLLESLDRFDPAREVRFCSFAAYRIRGSISNGIERSSDRLQQIGLRQRLRAERTASLVDQGEVDPTRSSEDLFDYLASVAIGLAVGCLLAGTGMVIDGDDTPDDRYLGAYAKLEVKQIRQRVRELVEQLPLRERLVIKGHYLNELSFESIAIMLDVTKGRISQIHKRGLDRLREAIADSSNFHLLG